MNSAHYPKLHKAIKLALRSHKNQDRIEQIPMPYILHPIEVLSYVREIGKVIDEDVLCAAVLHDTIESHTVTKKEILERFGPRVTKIVLELTRDEPSSKSLACLSKNDAWELRNRFFLDEIENKMGPEAKLIKLADRLSNLRLAQYKRNGNKFDRYIKQTHAILELITRDICPPLWDKLNEKLVSISTLNQ